MLAAHWPRTRGARFVILAILIAALLTLSAGVVELARGVAQAQPNGGPARGQTPPTTALPGSTSARPLIGLTYVPLSADLAEQHKLPRGSGALLTQVEPGSAASGAGLRAGDIVVRCNGNDVDEENSLAADILDEAPGSEVSMTILRGTSQLTVRMTLHGAGER